MNNYEHSFLTVPDMKSHSPEITLATISFFNTIGNTKELRKAQLTRLSQDQNVCIFLMKTHVKEIDGFEVGCEDGGKKLITLQDKKTLCETEARNQ